MGADGMLIDEMPAGREMDKLLAAKLGWKWDDKTATSPRGSKYDMQKCPSFWWLPDYSTDISAAWEVVEEIKPHVLRVDITISADTRLKPYAVLITGKGIREWWQSEGDTLSLAICRAALLAMGVTEL